MTMDIHNKIREQQAADFMDLLFTIKRQPQRQDSTQQQLLDLRMVANRLGMYDAADVIRNILER